MDLRRLETIASGLCEKKGWQGPRYIDNGASAAVYEVETKSGRAALKIYDPEFFEGENALIEVKRIGLQSRLKGHGCSELIDVIEADEIEDAGTWYLLMEFCPWSSLENKLPGVPDEKVHQIIKQLTQAVMFLEERGFVHRDIKPANIVVSDNYEFIKLLDFGVMRSVAFSEGSGTDGRKFIATAQYSPPEYLTRDEVPGNAGFNAINIYQIGAVLHDLITKAPIFNEEKATKNKFILFKAVTEKMPRIVSARVPPRLIAMCIAALDKDPVRRAGSVKLEDFLADADDLDSLRRRVANAPNSGKAKLKPPLVPIWKSKIGSWGREAARLEAETLGAFTMKELAQRDGLRWKLTFSSAATPIYLDVVKQDEFLAVFVLSDPTEARNASIFLIDKIGPNLPESGISTVIAAQYLFALDRALTSHATQPKEKE